MKHDLTGFLLARISDDESCALYALTRDPVDSRSPGGWGGWWYGHHAHYSRYTPDRVLIECEAKRKIVEQFSNVGWATYAVRDVLFELLALPYADHPDYQEEWRP